MHRMLTLLALGLVTTTLATTAHAEAVPVTFAAGPGPATATSGGAAPPTARVTLATPYTVRVFFADTLQKTFALSKEDFTLTLTERFDCGREVQVHSTNVYVPHTAFGQKHFDVELVPDPRTAKTAYGTYIGASTVGWVNYDSTYECARKATTVSLRLSRSYREAALPPIPIDFSAAADRAKIKALHTAVNEAGQDAFAPYVAIPQPGMRDFAVENEVVRLTKKGDPDVVAARAVLTLDGWDRDVDLAGRTTNRATDVAVVLKKKNGRCYVDPGGVTQVASGRGFGPVQLASTGQSPYVVSCAKAGFGGAPKK